MAKLMLSDALRDVSGPLGEFHQKLSGPDGASVWLPAFKRFLRKENPWDGQPFVPAWLTVEVGTYGSAVELIRELERRGMGVPDEIKALALSGQIPIAKERAKVSLITPTLAELDLSYTSSGFYHLHLATVGLMPCTLEMILLARLAYTNQPHDDSLHTIAEPCEVDGKKYEFMINCNFGSMGETSGLYIEAYELDGMVWRDDLEVMCALPYA